MLHVFVASVTETNVNVWSIVIPVSVTTTDPPAPIVAVVFAPPLTLYVTTCPAVPVNVNWPFNPEQTAASTALTETAYRAGSSIVTVFEVNTQKLPSVTVTA